MTLYHNIYIICYFIAHWRRDCGPHTSKFEVYEPIS